VRAAAVVLSLLLATTAWAQGPAPKPPAKPAAQKPAKPAVKASAKAPKAHRKPTPEQIKRFDQLEEKRGQR